MQSPTFITLSPTTLSLHQFIQFFFNKASTIPPLQAPFCLPLTCFIVVYGTLHLIYCIFLLLDNLFSISSLALPRLECKPWRQNFFV